MTIIQEENFISAEINSVFVDTLGKLRRDIGREVTLFFSSRTTQCPNCLFDITMNTSSDIYSPEDPYPAGIAGPIAFTGGHCAVCSGVGKLESGSSSSGIQVIVDSFSDREREHMQVGKKEGGGFRVQADISEFQAFLDVDKIIVDAIETEVWDIKRVGLKDLALCEVKLRRSDQNPSTVDYGLS